MDAAQWSFAASGNRFSADVDVDLQRAGWTLILNGRIHREQLRVELANTPRVRWRRRRALRRELDETIINLRGLISMVGPPRKENPWAS